MINSVFFPSPQTLCPLPIFHGFSKKTHPKPVHPENKPSPGPIRSPWFEFRPGNTIKRGKRWGKAPAWVCCLLGSVLGPPDPKNSSWDPSPISYSGPCKGTTQNFPNPITPKAPETGSLIKDTLGVLRNSSLGYFIPLKQSLMASVICGELLQPLSVIYTGHFALYGINYTRTHRRGKSKRIRLPKVS